MGVNTHSLVSQLLLSIRSMCGGRDKHRVGCSFCSSEEVTNSQMHGLACCHPWDHKESYMTEQLNWTEWQNWDSNIGLKTPGGEWRKGGIIADLELLGWMPLQPHLSLWLICQLSPLLLGPWPEFLGLLVLPNDRIDIRSLGLGTFFLNGLLRFLSCNSPRCL